MLIKRLLANSLQKRGLSLKFQKKNFYLFSELTQIQKKQLLQRTLHEVSLKKSKSIMLDDYQQNQQVKIRNFTKEQKLKLGLYVPKMLLNPRMNLNLQNQYKQQICQNLYDLQRASLNTGIRILQRQAQVEKFTINKYVNAIYKDIYARYLISKGIGVLWNGKYATFGVLNSQHLQQSPSKMIVNFLQNNISAMQKIKSIAPYSYLTSKYIPTDLIQVQNIRKIGYYFKIPLIQFGKYKQNFQKLIQRKNKVQLLVFSEYLQKLINPQCLCIIPGHKMIILKKNILENNSSQQSLTQEIQQTIKKEYLITSLEIFNKHKDYFTKENYQKHLFFDSQHLLEMKAQFQQGNSSIQNSHLSIIPETEGYQRDPGIYLVNAATNLPDYQRISYLEGQQDQLIYKITNPFDQFGKLKVITNTQQKQSFLSLIDLEFQEKFHEILKSKINFLELYDVFQDQIYSDKRSGQLLRFRLFQKYQIPIKQKSYQLLREFIQSPENELVINESKITIPSTTKFKKPRQRRQHRKNVRDLLKQKTSYMTLRDCIDSITNIPISTAVSGEMKLFLIKNQQKQIVKIVQNVTQINNSQYYQAEEITLSSDFLSAFTFMNSGSKDNQHLPSIIIEPQNFTEDILPICLHLNCLTQNSDDIRKGRRTSKQPSQQRKVKQLLQRLRMIYLHPTMMESQKDIEVDSFIYGSMKIVNKRDYGYGYQAMRLWVCRNADYLGDRELKQKDINQQLKHCSSIRKVFAELLPLIPTGFNIQNLNIQTSYKNLSLLDKFMIDQIDSYISNMEYFYSHLMLKQAYEYTLEFFRDIVDQIFVQTIRKNIIAFPNKPQNLNHSLTIKRILELLGVISPLFPFSAYHISKTQIMKWPQKINKDTFYQNLLQYNALIKIRTQLHNKLAINKFQHSEVVFPTSNQMNYSQRDLQLFFGVDKVTFQQPEIEQKKFGFKLRFNQSLGGKTKLNVYESKDTSCIRCDPKSKQKQYLCTNCMDYLEQNVGEHIQFYSKNNNSLIEQENKQIEENDKNSWNLTPDSFQKFRDQML